MRLLYLVFIIKFAVVKYTNEDDPYRNKDDMETGTLRAIIL